MTRYVTPRRDYMTVLTRTDFMEACGERDRLVREGCVPPHGTIRVKWVLGAYAVQIGVPRSGQVPSYER